jgi:hypothetical protein
LQEEILAVAMAELIHAPASSSDSEEEFFDASFFVDESYVIKEYGVGAHAIKVMCLQCSSTDYDLTGQLVWPGAELLNDYLANHSEILNNLSVIELGSGVGLTGLLCARYCRHVVMTDHNTTVLKVMKRNVEMQASSDGGSLLSKVDCEELEWGSDTHLMHIKEKFPNGFDLILGADIYILFFSSQQSSFCCSLVGKDFLTRSF